MAKVVEAAEAKEKQNLLLDGVHKLFLVGLGAAMTAQDELSDLSHTLLDRGEKVQEKSRQRFGEFRKKESKRLEEEWDRQVEGILHRLNVPTTAEIEALGTKITRLTRKVDELNKAVTQTQTAP